MELKDLMKQVYSNGFNIYKLVNRFRKELDYEMPDKVIEIVCNNYLKYKPKIRNEWAYLAKILKMERDKFFAQKEINQSQEYKKMTNATLLRDIFAKKEK